MSEETEPTMIALFAFQRALNAGLQVNELDADYVELNDVIEGVRRCSYAKFVDGKVQVLVTFRREEPISGLECYSVNYSVGEKYRRHGLAVEAFNRGIQELKKKFNLSNMSKFYVDTFVETTNVPSIETAKKIFSSPGLLTRDGISGRPSMYFRLLITIS